MSIGNIEYSDAKIDAKRMNTMRKDIDRLYRLIRRSTSTIATGKTITNPSGTPQKITVDHGDLTGLSDDDHGQYFRVDGDRVMTGDIDLDNNDINNINVSRYNITPTNASPAEGDIWWNASEKTINVFDGQGAIQVGFESGIRGYNDTGSLINNGDIVYISGATGGRGNIVLAKADTHESSVGTLGMVTEEGGIADGVEGRVTTFGVVNDIDTSGMSVGDQVYLSDSIAGAYINLRPVHPSFTIQVGVVMTVDASTGSILFDVDVRDNDNVLNGTTLENFDALVSSNGTVITMSLEKSGGGDITARFAEGYSTIDCTPALTIALTAGTTSVPQMNFIYIPESTKVLTKSLSGYPTDEVYVEIGRFYVQSATDVQSDGALINQNINNYTASVTNQMGRVALLSQRLRKERAQWDAGVDANGATSSYFTIGAGTVDWLSTSGTIWQMHLQTIPAIDMSTGDHAHVINDFTTSFNTIADLFEITEDATGTTITNNRYFSLVFWIAGNKGGEYSPLMVNLPNGFYTLQSAALVDADNYSVFEIPREFAIDTSTGFLVARATFQMGSTWDLIEVEDLRGKSPSTAGGGATSTIQTEFNDSTFSIFDLDDITRKLKYDAGSITTGNTRTWTIPDKSITVAGLDDITADIATHAAISDAHHSKTISSEIDHDATTNFVSGEHFLQSAINTLGTVTVGDIDAIANYIANTDAIANLAGKVSGDVFYWTTALQRLAKGTDDQVLTLASGVPAWATNVSGVTDHTLLTNIGTNTHVQIDAHLALVNEHIDWTGASAGTIHATNYVDTDTTYVSSDFIHDDLTGFVANEHIDWSITGGTQIHADRYTDNDTTYVSSDFTHNSLSGLNDGAVYNHMTDAQITALHAEVTELAHSAITGVGTSDHHVKTVDTWRGIDDVPVNGQTAESISSNWAYDHIVEYGDANMIGSANSVFIPCTLEGDASGNMSYVAPFGGMVKNVGAGDMNISYVLPLPAIKGGLTLTVTNFKIVLFDADSDDYVSQIRIYTTSQTGHTQKYSDTDNLTYAGTFNDGSSGSGWSYPSLTDFTIAEGQRVGVQISCGNTGAGQLQIAGIYLKCYYS